jgi:hypothetical protein
LGSRSEPSTAGWKGSARSGPNPVCWSSEPTPIGRSSALRREVARSGPFEEPSVPALATSNHEVGVPQVLIPKSLCEQQPCFGNARYTVAQAEKCAMRGRPRFLPIMEYDTGACPALAITAVAVLRLTNGSRWQAMARFWRASAAPSPDVKRSTMNSVEMADRSTTLGERARLKTRAPAPHLRPFARTWANASKKPRENRPE